MGLTEIPLLIVKVDMKQGMNSGSGRGGYAKRVRCSSAQKDYKSGNGLLVVPCAE